MADDDAYLQADAEDARAALEAATGLASVRGDLGLVPGEKSWLKAARDAYRFLRSRDSLRVVSIQIVNGTPSKEGTPLVTATLDLSDANQIPLSLTGLDVKDAATPLPDGFTATWTLADPDGSGAILTPSADGTTAVLAAGSPDSNVMVSVAVTFTDPVSGQPVTLNGAEAVIVQASAAVTVGIVPGTPTPEAPPSA